ncbi:guanylate-binding protein 7-like isoform X2 [Ranitomeya variabilis]|uniref:guanylate-binding protein 7-like isoform X2 n=1 Tax=Ranitomeya variabilis TaxID=490064 RepID=UPI004056479F
MAPLLPMPRPICLIENVDGNTLVLNKEAEKILLEISQPVVVIAIVGKYRTGKSYLMNKLAGSRTGFPLGSTIQSKTKGIWMWCVPHPQKSGQTLVLLDTEGLGDVEKGDCKNDAWIFSLAVMLSSSLVFNSLGTIDQQSIEQLHYVTELTKLIKLKSSTEEVHSGDYKRYMPSFTWCVRDFTLTLEKNGKEITEDEYLLSSLELKKGTDEKTKIFNLSRDCILHFFHEHKCFVFDRPGSKKQLQILEELEESELDEDFVEQTTRFYSYMMHHSQAKSLAGGAEVTGRMLVVLAASYVAAIQSGTVPCMENAVLALAKIENSGAVQDAMSKYQCEMEKCVLKFPTETQQEFLNMHMECEKEAIVVFMGRSLNDEDQKYQKKLKELSATMENDILAGIYFVPGGHKLYLMEKLKVIEAYNTRPGKGIKSLEVIQKYIIEKKDIEAAIIKADETLTEKERQLAEERAQAENAVREKQIIEQNTRNMQQFKEDQPRSFEQHKAMLMEKMEQERKMMVQQNELVIARKLKEQEMMMNLQNQMSDLKKEIKKLQEENSKSGCNVM